eukprot:6207658-Pleurochrysis_carterae.AAC.4
MESHTIPAVGFTVHYDQPMLRRQVEALAGGVPQFECTYTLFAPRDVSSTVAPRCLYLRDF